jgi:hypothetical protein
VLSAHPWSFASGQATLPQLAAKPVADFAHAFQLPNGFLRALSAGVEGRGRGITYRINEGRLHADAEQVTLTYIFRPDESAFPPFFAACLVCQFSDERVALGLEACVLLEPLRAIM